MSEHHVVTSREALSALVDTLRGEPIIGLDTEFLRERTYYPQLALIQLRWPSGRAIVDPLAVDPAPLGQLLEGPALWVVHAATQDIEVLEHAVGAVPARLFDPQIAAGFLGYRSPSLETLVREELGAQLDKGDQLTDWTRRPLTDAQLRYAIGDVEHLLDLHVRLEARLEGRGRLAWVQEESDRVRAREQGRRAEPETAWWRLKGRAKMGRRPAGVAQALAAYREREAARLDVLTRHVLSDMAILSMAHRPPTSIAELRAVRGLELSKQASARAEHILTAVREGLSMSAEGLRIPPAMPSKDQPPAALVTLCLAWVAQRAADEDLDPVLLATRDEVTSFVAGDRDGRLTSGFREAIVGHDLARILTGEVAVAAGPDGRLQLR